MADRLARGRRVNVKMSKVKPAGDLDAEVVQREATSAVPPKGPDDPPSRAMIEAHNLTHLPVLRGVKSVFKPEGQATGTRKSRTIARYRACKWTFTFFQFISGVAVWCPEAHAKADVLTMVDMDTGYVGVLMVSGKSPDNFIVRSTASFVDKLKAEKTRLRYDNEPAMRQLAEKTATLRQPRTAILEPVDAEACNVRAQSIPASKSQRRNPLGNQNGHVLQKSSASFHGGVHDQSADRPSRSQEET